MKNIRTVWLDTEGVKLLNQKLLPSKVSVVLCKTPQRVAKAISSMEIRGAPAIGCAAALGVALSARQHNGHSSDAFIRNLQKDMQALSLARPTGVNLSWAIGEMMSCLEKAALQARRLNGSGRIRFIQKTLFREAAKILKKDRETNKNSARWGASLIQDGDKILTYCNTGALATSGYYGTALGVLKYAWEQKKKILVYVSETRPYLQGARLTAWELKQYGIPGKLICDNMAGYLMERKEVTKVLVGADRVSANGDVANKIGTYTLAVLAQKHRLPFYVVAPGSSFDLSIARGSDIPIEQRKPEEVTEMLQKGIVPNGFPILHPAFDVTPHKLVTAFVTENGILKKPFRKSFKRLFAAKK